MMLDVSNCVRTYIKFNLKYILGDPESQSLWFRIVIATYYLCISVSFMCCLNSELKSSMAIKRDEDHVDSFADVLRFKRMRIYAEADSVLSEFMTVCLNSLPHFYGHGLYLVIKLYHFNNQIVLFHFRLPILAILYND